MTSVRALKVGIAKLAHGADLPLPAYQTSEAAGLDLLAAVPENSPLHLKPGARALVPTGVVLDLPKGVEAQVRPRSGLAFNHGVTVLNSPGTIDSDYRGEVKVLLINLGDKPFKIARGERIAQLVIATVTRVRLQEVDITRATARGTGGFGSTGTKGGATPSQRLRATHLPKADSKSERPPGRKPRTEGSNAKAAQAKAKRTKSKTVA